MSELSPNAVIREELLIFLRKHKDKAVAAGNSAAKIILGIVTTPKHPRFLEIGETVNQGWYGEGGLSISYMGKIESFGGEMVRGGVKDAEVGEVRPDLLMPEERRFLKQVLRDPGNLLGEEFGE